jgi:[ribosomal protein S5]-alanine N-acetyltransferase
VSGRGAGVAVRLVTEDDVPALTRLLRANRDHLAPTSPDRPADHGTEAYQRGAVVRALDLHRQGLSVPGVVLLDGELVGEVSVANVVRGPLLSGDLGYWVAREATGRGVATAAAAAMVAMAFGDAGLHRLEAGTLVDNRASQRVLERTGFERIGLARGYLRIAGEWRDHVLFQLTDDGPEVAAAPDVR